MLEDVNKILIVEFGFVGDLIVTTPVYRALKHRYPHAEIDVIIQKGMRDVLHGNTNISNLIESSPKEVHKLLPEIKDKYDLGIILHYGSWKISKLLKKAKIPFRIGCTRPGITEGKGFSLHRKTKPSFWKLKILDNLDVIKTIGITPDKISPELFVDSSVESDILSRLPEKYVVIHASPQHQNHKWFIDRWAKVADSVSFPVIFTGSKKDSEYNQRIMELMNKDARNLAGTSLKEFFAIIKNASLVISVDTSAMHVAAAFNKRVISLFGAGDPNVWKPYADDSTVLFHGADPKVCTTCLRHKCRFKDERIMECMKAISVEEVIRSIER